MRDDIIPFVLAVHQNRQCETLDQARALLQTLAVRPLRNVNLFVMDMRSADPLGFGMLETKQNVDLRGGVARLGDYPDWRWVEHDVFPHYLKVKQENQHYFDGHVEWAPRAGHDQATSLTVRRVC